MATVRLTEQFRQRLSHQLDDALRDEQHGLTELRTRLTTRLTHLDTKEDNLLELVGDPAWPRAKLQKKLASLAAERSEIHAQLADTSSTLDTGRRFFEHAFELLADPQGFYRRGNAGVKKAIVKIIFRKLRLDAHQVGGHELAPGIKELVEVGSATAGGRGHGTYQPDQPTKKGLPPDGGSPS